MFVCLFENRSLTTKVKGAVFAIVAARAIHVSKVPLVFQMLQVVVRSILPPDLRITIFSHSPRQMNE